MNSIFFTVVCLQTHVGVLFIFIVLCSIGERVTFKLAADALAFQP